MLQNKILQVSSVARFAWGLIILLFSVLVISLTLIFFRLNAAVCPPCYAPEWSPDGQWIAFTVDVGTQASDIWVMRIDGSEPINLTTDRQGRDRHPTWSPDNRRLAFTGDSNIWVINADGSNPVNLTPSTPNLDWMPAWSPDGQWIAFSSNREGDYDIFIMRPDGTDLRNLTRGSTLNDEAPAWILNTNTIVYAAARKTDRSVYDIQRIDADGGNWEIILTNDKYNYAPAASSHSIIFTSTTANDEDVWIMESDGSAVRNLTNTIFADNEAVWSPDGGQIAFVSYRDGGSHIWLMNADGTNLRKLETGGYSLRTQIAIIGLVTVASLSLIGGGWYLWRRRSEIAVIAA